MPYIEQEAIRNKKYTTAGWTTAYTLTVPNTPALYDGLAVTVKMNATNTGSSTLNVNALWAKTLKKPDGTNLSSGDLTINWVYQFVYDLAQDFFFVPSLGLSWLPSWAIGVLDGSNTLSIYLNSAWDFSASDVRRWWYAVVNWTNYLFCIAAFYSNQNVSGWDEHIFLSVFALEKSTGKIKTQYWFNQSTDFTNALNVDDTNGYLYITASVGLSLYYEFPTNTITTSSPWGAYTNVGYGTYETPVPSGATYAAGTATVATDTYGGKTYSVIRTSVDIGASEARAFARLQIS